jgi:glucosyl-3-phosphoglycerate synthase
VSGDGAGGLRTYRVTDFDVDDLVRRKRRAGLSISVVLPARDEAATVAGVVEALAPLRRGGLVDELLVVDSFSTDATAELARGAGADVVHAADVRPEIPAVRGKGEAMWRGLLATSGDLVAYCDTDVLDSGPHFVVGLVGPMLHEPEVELVKGFYRRPIVGDGGDVEEHGGRVTELTARPWLSVYRPELARFVQPLAGEWAGRRTLLESLPYPVGYGVEIAVLLDTHTKHGIGAMAQCDLGVRTHRRQSQQRLGVMAAQVLAAAGRRSGLSPAGTTMHQYDVDHHTAIDTELAIDERPPAATHRTARRDTG